MFKLLFVVLAALMALATAAPYPEAAPAPVAAAAPAPAPGPAPKPLVASVYSAYPGAYGAYVPSLGYSAYYV